MRAIVPLLLLVTGCAAQPAIGPPSERPSIVSLNPCADAILAEVAEPGQVLAISHYSHDPSTSSMDVIRARDFATTGGTAEEVIVLAPDVVVADVFLAPSMLTALEKAGIRVEQLGIASDLEASLAQVRQLAALAGADAGGELLIRQIETSWNAAASDDPSIETLLWQQGGIVPGEDTLAAAMLAQAGFTLHSAARGLGQGAYLPLEHVVADPPELVLAASDERMLGHPVLRQLDGVRYETFDPTLLYCGGPTIPRALERLGAIRQALE